MSSAERPANIPLRDEARFTECLAALRRRLSEPLPGWSAMMRMAPSGRRFVSVTDARRAGCREACTLVLLYPRDGEAYTVLTLRSPMLRDHAGQVSLPGGAIDDGETTVECAAREAYEELAVAGPEFEILGRLTPLYIPPSNFCISPVVAACRRRPSFEPHSSEVAEVIEVPLSLLLADGARRVESWSMGGNDRLVPYYAIGPHKVWGATAMVLCELAAAWSGLARESMAGPATGGRVHG